MAALSCSRSLCLRTAHPPAVAARDRILAVRPSGRSTTRRLGLFHVFSDEDRRRYVEGLATDLKPGGRLFLMCFSDEEPGTQGPRRVTKKELYDAFATGWVIESVEPSRYEVRPDLKDLSFSEGGPKAWFVVVRRTGV